MSSKAEPWPRWGDGTRMRCWIGSGLDWYHSDACHGRPVVARYSVRGLNQPTASREAWCEEHRRELGVRKTLSAVRPTP